MKSVSIIVPAYNEGENIVPALEEMVATCETAKLTFEILVVNDCSTDDTGEKAKVYSQNRKEVRVIDNPVNLGFGSLRDYVHSDDVFQVVSALLSRRDLKSRTLNLATGKSFPLRDASAIE